MRVLRTCQRAVDDLLGAFEEAPNLREILDRGAAAIMTRVDQAYLAGEFKAQHLEVAQDVRQIVLAIMASAACNLTQPDEVDDGPDQN